MADRYVSQLYNLDRPLLFLSLTLKTKASLAVLLRQRVGSGWSAGAKTLRTAALIFGQLNSYVLRTSLVSQRSHSPHRQCLESHWIPASHSNGPLIHTSWHPAS